MNRRDFVKLMMCAAATPLISAHAAQGEQPSKIEENVKTVDPDAVSKEVYDAIVVGAGVAGVIAAKQLSNAGKRVLIIEAGSAESLTSEGFKGYVENFYSAVAKHANSPYPSNSNALSPTDGRNGYFEEQGPLPVSGSYTRVVGGTTMHWEGKTLRMLPEDFSLKEIYGVGLDWPLSYEDLQPYYEKAEYEIGVAGDIEEQRHLGVPFREGYLYPMEKIPPSYLDEQVRKKVDGTVVKLDSHTVTLQLSTFPQGRNSRVTPNASYSMNGLQCHGSASCVPICPMQAKYDARRTIRTFASPGLVHILPKAVASRIEIAHENGRVSAVHYKHYRDKNAPDHMVGTAKGRVYVLAANAVENARLMLASNLLSTSGLMGRNLMDHPHLLAWGLMPDVVGTMRGPLVTSGIGAFRKGSAREKQAAFSVDVHNDGWAWAGISAADVLRDVVDNAKIYGSELRQEMLDRISRQLLLAFMIEMPANSSNRVSVDPRYRDQLGNCRPVMHFDMPDYTKRTMAYARNLSKTIFGKLGVEDHTEYANNDPAYFEYDGVGYWFRGGNHFSGTHIMGTTKHNSVVDSNLRSWDHENLYLLGSGSMPSIGTANTTLTIAALSFRASEQMIRDLSA